MLGRLVLVLAVAITYMTTRPVESSNQDVALAAKATCQDPGPSCFLAFFANFGFAGQNGGYPYNVSVFDNAVNDYIYQNNVAGWMNLQRWMNTLITCYGGNANFEACIDTSVLMNTYNISKQEATIYDYLMRIYEYEITPQPFGVITHNWFCIKGVDANEGPVIQMCRQHFIDQQHNQPNMTCQHLGELLNCIERPYVTHCGRDVAAVLCQVEKIIYSVTAPNCASHVALHCRGALNPFMKRAQLH